MSVRASTVEKASSCTTTPPGRTVFKASRHVATLNATRMSTLSERAMWPSGVIRSWYQVGRPSMLEGNTFFGATGIPMRKIALVRTRFAVWLPEPLTVAAWMVRSLTMGSVTSGASSGFYAPARPGLDSLLSTERESRRSQGDRAGRAPRRPRPGHGEDAGRRRPGSRRRGGCRRGCLHPGRPVREGRRHSGKPRRDDAPRSGCRPEAPGAARERDRGPEEGRRAHQLPAVGHAGRHREDPGPSRDHLLQPVLPPPLVRIPTDDLVVLPSRC